MTARKGYYQTDKWRQYFRSWYHNNKAVVTENNHSYRMRKLKKFFDAVRHRLFCVKCGERDLACLDFHHRNPDEKECCVVQRARNGTVEAALVEAEKCDVLCSNCHRKFHHSEFFKQFQ